MMSQTVGDGLNEDLGGETADRFWKQEKESNVAPSHRVLLDNKEQGGDKSKSNEREEESFPNTVSEIRGVKLATLMSSVWFPF